MMLCIWLTLVHWCSCCKRDLLYQVVFMLLQSTPAYTNIFVCDLVHSLVQDFQRYEAFFVIGEDFPQNKCLAKYERNWFPSHVGELSIDLGINKVQTSPGIGNARFGSHLVSNWWTSTLAQSFCNNSCIWKSSSCCPFLHFRQHARSLTLSFWQHHAILANRVRSQRAHHAWKINNSTIRVVITLDDFTESTIRST